MKLGLASYEHLVDLKCVHGLRGITALPSGGAHIGAASTHREIETSAVLQASYPEMSAMTSQVANVRVRSVRTLGGNLCFADPHSDPASFLLAADAVFVCQHGETIRRIPAASFFTGLYETALAPGELLTAVELPSRPDRAALSHLRFTLTERPAVTITAMLTLAAGGERRGRRQRGSPDRRLGGQRPVRRGHADPGRPLDRPRRRHFEARAEQCAGQAAAVCAPLSDGEASVEYLRHLVFLHARQALRDAFARAS